MSRGVLVGVLAALITEVLYGGSFAFTKAVTGTIDPVALLGWRFVLALAAMLVLVGLGVVRLTITRRALRPLLLLALFQPLVYYVAETWGVHRTTASESGLIISAIPVVMVLTSAIVVGTRPSGRQVVGIGITLGGVVAITVAGGLTVGVDLLGYLLLFVAVLAYALYAAFAERYSHTSDVDRTFVMIAAGAVAFGTMAVVSHAASGTMGELAMLPLRRPDFAVALAYLAFGTTIGAFFLQNVAIRVLGATRYSTFIGVASLAALASGMIALGERPGWVQLAGGTAILAGVYIANQKQIGATTDDLLGSDEVHESTPTAQCAFGDMSFDVPADFGESLSDEKLAERG